MKNWRTFSLKTLLVLTAICAIYLSWRVYKFEHGVIDEWVDAVLVDSKSNPFENYVLSWPQANQAITIPCQADIPVAQQIKLLRKSLRWLPTEQRRNCVLKIIAEQFPEEAHDLFIQISKETKHEHLIRNTLLLSSIFRIENDIAHYEQFLSHQSGLVRSAAVDAIGMVHHPSFPIPAGSDNFGLQLGFQSDPRIHLRYIADLISDESDLKRRHTTSEIWNDQSERALSPKAKEKIKQLLINDPDPQVRSAAARAARNWHPKNYQLRLAEWGVWINEGENLVLAQSIVDEIPPFVHRVGNDMNSITSGRTNAFIIVTKPIIHFLVDQSMVVDISVRISGGRPWFGYPMPDDFLSLAISLSHQTLHQQHNWSRFSLANSVRITRKIGLDGF